MTQTHRFRCMSALLLAVITLSLGACSSSVPRDMDERFRRRYAIDEIPALETAIPHVLESYFPEVRWSDEKHLWSASLLYTGRTRNLKMLRRKDVAAYLNDKGLLVLTVREHDHYGAPLSPEIRAQLAPYQRNYPRLTAGMLLGLIERRAGAHGEIVSHSENE